MKKLNKTFFAAALVLSAPLPIASGLWFYDEVTTPQEEKLDMGGVDMTLPAGVLFGLTALPFGVVGYTAYRSFTGKLDQKDNNDADAQEPKTPNP